MFIVFCFINVTLETPPVLESGQGFSRDPLQLKVALASAKRSSLAPPSSVILPLLTYPVIVVFNPNIIVIILIKLLSTPLQAM